MLYLSCRNNEKIKLKNHNNILKILFLNMEQWKNIRLKLSQGDPIIEWQGKKRKFISLSHSTKVRLVALLRAVIKGPRFIQSWSSEVPKAESQHVRDKGEGLEVAPTFLFTFKWQQFKSCGLRKPARETGKKRRTNFGRQLTDILTIITFSVSSR